MATCVVSFSEPRAGTAREAFCMVPGGSTNCRGAKLIFIKLSCVEGGARVDPDACRWPCLPKGH